MERNVWLIVWSELILEKAGVAPEETIGLVKYVRENCPHLEFIGLMTIGSASASHSAAEQQRNPDFEVCTFSLPSDCRH